MVKYDRIAHIKSIHAQRKADTRKKVDNAIEQLIRMNGKINFNSVSSKSGVTKATLYNNVDIRKRIETLRQQQSQVSSPKQIKHKMNENNKDALIEILKRKISKLEEENTHLRKQVKIAYAQIYEKV
ncbi:MULTISPECIES: DUF6262 family protein [Bacillus]|jgi:alcohol dehydrogenase class IV|uniref:DUF6262 family protein n=1 Tax=Bacillus TaxID=1386 RepID=UPI000C34D400|nr:MULTISPECIES: DUF6262 family protein [Bacillus cereus group]AUD21356.1 transposase [Bacillus sp. HBCD-sjtu]MDA1808754.1 DUF6262 family protein [Bacillus cereus]NKW84130.1 transposase [Bacillus cereus]HDR4389863.1 transposase [Bacillus cereus]HDR4600452.1 transposase [Bacillus cereus]